MSFSRFPYELWAKDCWHGHSGKYVVTIHHYGNRIQEKLSCEPGLKDWVRVCLCEQRQVHSVVQCGGRSSGWAFSGLENKVLAKAQRCRSTVIWKQWGISAGFQTYILGRLFSLYKQKPHWSQRTVSHADGYEKVAYMSRIAILS